MRKLHLVGLTTDRDGLIFTARKGSKSGGYIVPLDQKLLTAIMQANDQGNGAPVMDIDAGPAEAPVVAKRLRSESALTPREMQARLRAGRSIDEVAAEAGVDTEWVARFAVPILAEQAQVVELARAVVYAKPRLGESTQPLGQSVLQNLSDRGVFLPDDVANAGWSAFQLHDSVWMVRFRYRSRARDQEAQWEIDVPTGRLRARNRHASDLGYVGPERWEAVEEPEETPVNGDASPPPVPRRATPERRSATTATRRAAPPRPQTQAGKPTTKAPQGGTAPKARKAGTAPKAPRAAKAVKGLRASAATKALKAGTATKAVKAGTARKAVRAGAATKATKAIKAGTAAKAVRAGKVAKGTRTSATKAQAPVAEKAARATPVKRRAAKAAPAADGGPTAGSGSVRMAVAQVSTARVAASMAAAEREPWAQAVRRPPRAGALGDAGSAGSSRRAGASTPRVAGRAVPAPEPLGLARRSEAPPVRAFEPRPLPPPGQEPKKPQIRKLPAPRARRADEDGPAVSLPAPRVPTPRQESLPADRPKRRRLRSR